MAKTNKKNEKKNNMENEIVIGVTTKPKEKVRVEKKSTRTTAAKSNPSNNKKRNTNNIPHSKSNAQKKTSQKKMKSEEEIKKINRKRMALSMAMLFLIAIGGTIYYLTTPAFNIQNIVVYGNEKISVDTYISLSKLNIGSTNLFAFTNGSIKERLKENAYVEDVTVKRKLPNTIELYVTERKVAYQIAYSNQYIDLDSQGYILEIQDKKLDFPIIKGFSSIQQALQPGKRLDRDDLVKLNIVSKIINYCKYNNIENQITSLDVTDTSNYILNFEKDNKIVYLGDASNISERLSLLKTILKNEKGKKGEIFMNGDLNQDKVYFREEVAEEKK